MSDAREKALDVDRHEWCVDHELEPEFVANTFLRGWDAAIKHERERAFQALRKFDERLPGPTPGGIPDLTDAEAESYLAEIRGMRADLPDRDALVKAINDQMLGQPRARVKRVADAVLALLHGEGQK